MKVLISGRMHKKNMPNPLFCGDVGIVDAVNPGEVSMAGAATPPDRRDRWDQLWMYHQARPMMPATAMIGNSMDAIRSPMISLLVGLYSAAVALSS